MSIRQGIMNKSPLLPSMHHVIDYNSIITPHVCAGSLHTSLPVYVLNVTRYNDTIHE